MAPAGEEAREIVYQEIGDKRILANMAGNNRYIAVTEDIVYIGSVGVSSGSWFGKKVKRYPIDAITSVDVSKALFTVDLEIVMAGAFESGRTGQGLMDRVRNENIIVFSSREYENVQHLADLILDIQQKRKNNKTQPMQVDETRLSIPEQIKQLWSLNDAGIISNEEFEAKKKELLSRM